uniref:BLOC-1-related complex subunit 7 n=1 Tax=Caenorhabditis tropicalis TaxID=1561998 RepID=A0A1I7SXC1_9PELO
MSGRSPDNSPPPPGGTPQRSRSTSRSNFSRETTPKVRSRSRSHSTLRQSVVGPTKTFVTKTVNKVITRLTEGRRCLEFMSKAKRSDMTIDEDLAAARTLLHEMKQSQQRLDTLEAVVINKLNTPEMNRFAEKPIS